MATKQNKAQKAAEAARLAAESAAREAVAIARLQAAIAEDDARKAAMQAREDATSAARDAAPRKAVPATKDPMDCLPVVTDEQRDGPVAVLDESLMAAMRKQMRG